MVWEVGNHEAYGFGGPGWCMGMENAYYYSEGWCVGFGIGVWTWRMDRRDGV